MVATPNSVLERWLIETLLGVPDFALKRRDVIARVKASYGSLLTSED